MFRTAKAEVRYGRQQAGELASMFTTLIELRADIDLAINDGFTPIAMAAQENHDETVRLLAHMGARLTFTPVQVGRLTGFWCSCQEEVKRLRMAEFWTRIIEAGGDAPTEESLRIRRKMMIEAKMFDPR